MKNIFGLVHFLNFSLFSIFPSVRRIRFDFADDAATFPKFRIEGSTPVHVRPSFRPRPKDRASPSPKAPPEIQDFESFERLPYKMRRLSFTRMIANEGKSDKSSESDQPAVIVDPMGLNLCLNFSDSDLMLAWVSPPGVSRLDIFTLFETVLKFLPQKKNNAGAKPIYNLDGFDGFVLTLLVLRNGMSFEKAAHFLSKTAQESSARKCVSKWLNALSKWVDESQQIEFFKPKDWLKECKTSCNFQSDYPNHLIYFMDGTPIETLKFSDFSASSVTWNQKHQMNSFSFFILVTPSGKIAYISSIEGGSVHDATHFRSSGVSEKLEEFYSNTSSSYQLCLGGDKGYRAVIPPQKFISYITKSGEKAGDADNTTNDQDSGVNLARNERIIFDPSIAKHRCVVERVFCHLKKWEILLSRHHLMLACFTNQVVRVIGGLYNYLYRQAP